MVALHWCDPPAILGWACYNVPMNLQKLRGRLLLSLLLGAAVFVGLSATFDNPVILSPPEADEESGPFVRLRRTQGDSPGKPHPYRRPLD